MQRRNFEHTDCPKATPPRWLHLSVFDIPPIRLVRKGDGEIDIAPQHALNGVRLQVADKLKRHARQQPRIFLRELVGVSRTGQAHQRLASSGYRVLLASPGQQCRSEEPDDKTGAGSRKHVVLLSGHRNPASTRGGRIVA
jgi:hypothetical protein